METIVRFYKPGLPINLYNSAQHKFCHGVLVFFQGEPVSSPSPSPSPSITLHNQSFLGVSQNNNLTLWDSSQSKDPFSLPSLSLESLKQTLRWEEIKKSLRTYIKSVNLDAYFPKFFNFTLEKYNQSLTLGKLLLKKLPIGARLPDFSYQFRNWNIAGSTSFAGVSSAPADANVFMPQTVPSHKFFLKGVAIGLLFVSFFGITISFLPIAHALRIYTKPKTELYNRMLQRSDSEVNPNNPNAYTNSFILSEDGHLNNDFKIKIPKINLESDVIANVDSANEDNYKSELQKGVAHANGSYFPGEEGPVFLFAHSTDTVFNIEQYNAKFFALKDTEPGDEIKINFRGKEFLYKIKSKEIINPSDIDKIRETKADLILSTCFPPGTNWQRLIVYAELVSADTK
jgi:LPXTG-site transpeptidase (sortase) family protein